MCYPKCGSKNIMKLNTNRRITPRGSIILIKRFTCINCFHNFDYNKMEE